MRKSTGRTRWPEGRWRLSFAASVVSGLIGVSSEAFAKDYKSGEAISHQRFGFGAFEARIWGARGPGVISTFFLWKPGSELPWIPWEEIDFELGPRNGHYQTQIMTPGIPGETERTEHNIYHNLPVAPWSAYHTYRIEWTPESIAFFVDGHEVRRETDPVEYAALFNVDGDGDTPADERMELRVGAWPAAPSIFPWAGEFDGSSLPTAVFVDYVRVWDHTPGQADPFGTLLLSDDFEGHRSDWWYSANWTFDASASDYVPDNIGLQNGRRVIAVTDNAGRGQIPSPPDDVPHDHRVVPAEAYDAFFDTTPGNRGTPRCSATDVDAQLATDPNGNPWGGECNIAWTATGEWLEYDVDLEEEGAYDLLLRIASHPTLPSQVYVQIDGAEIAEVEGPGAGWQAWTDAIVPEQFLSAGTHVVRLSFVGQVNVNYLVLEPLEDAGDDDGGDDDGLGTTGGYEATTGYESTGGEEASTTGSETGGDDPEEPAMAEGSIRLTSDWGGGYCADLTISSSTGIPSWLATVETPGAQIYTSWNTSLSGSGPIYALGPVSWNANIMPGGSQTVGFCANRTTMSAPPSLVMLTF